MRTFFVFILLVLITASCKEPVKKETFDPTGKWQSQVPWNNNDVTLTVKKDSMMLFFCKRLFCPGTKYFISVGKWHIEKDSILVMQQYTDGRKYSVEELFPGLAKTFEDSTNIVPLDMEARFIITKDRIYDIEKDGKRSKDKIYIRK